MLPPAADGIDFVHEDDTWLVVASIVEHLTNEASRLTDVLVNDSAGHDLQLLRLLAFSGK